MLFWLICLILTLLVAAKIVTPLLRPARDVGENPDIAIYKAQLSEIDRDLARDLLAPQEAERARTEVARRLLAASKQTDQTSATNPTKGLPAIVAAILLLVTFGTYWQLGAPGYGDLPIKERLAQSEQMRENRPDQTALEAAAAAPPAVDAPADYIASVEQLRIIAPTRPDDLQAWELLAYHETELRNFRAAYIAQQKVIDLKGDTATGADNRILLDLMVSAGGGYVSPQAEVIIRDMLTADPGNIAALYYLGQLYNQTDRPDLAVRFWRDLAANGDPRQFHIAAAREQITDAAQRAGIRYSLPETLPDNLDPAEMVASLADRLATNGGPPADWARLITSYGVLGDSENARAIWVEARDVFGSNQNAMQLLTDAATRAGVAE